MDTPLYFLGLLAIVATVIVLLLGIGAFGKGGEFSAKHGNKMMRLRLLFQFIAVVLLMGYVYFRN